MKSIEITTSHNIVVSVELANVVQRIIACLIDITIIIVYSAIMAFVSQGITILAYLLIMPGLCFYSLIFEIFNKGQSVGKMLLKLKVVALDGERPSVNDFIMRWLFRIIDIWLTLGAMGIIFVSSTGKNQRIGDILGNTSVVKLNNQNVVQLNRIKEIGEYKKDIKYPAIVRYNDKDMLLVKQALKRNQISPTSENRIIVSNLTKRIAEDLDLKEVPRNHTSFLRLILEEYIVLTR